MGARKEYVSTNARIPILTERLIAVIKENGGVSRVSALTGISRNTITFWCQGARTPDAANLITLSNKLHVSVDYLLGLHSSPTLDETIKAVEDYTGLSKKAIQNLRILSKDDLLRKPINELLSSESFVNSFMDSVLSVFEISEEGHRYFEEINGKTLSKKRSKLVAFDLSHIIHELRYSVFDVSENAAELVNSILGINEFKKELKEKKDYLLSFEEEAGGDGEHEVDGD